MKTVGKNVFGIKHHCARYEFAPGRGQIHVHMLCICEDNSIYQLCHDGIQKPNGKRLRAERLANFAREKFGLTADLPELSKSTVGIHPCSMRLSESDDDVDGHMMMRHCQEHNCSGHIRGEHYGYIFRQG